MDIEVITDKTLSNLRDVLNYYYKIGLQRCEPKSARNTAINRVKAELEEFLTNWETAKSQSII